MSVTALKNLLREARAELSTFVRHVGDGETIADKAWVALSYSHKKLAARIGEALSQSDASLRWDRPESGSWHAKHENYEINIYKEAGEYHWQVACTDARPAESLEEAKSVVARLVGLE